MNGAIADPDEIIKIAPNNIRMMISGNSQNFFLTLRKAHRSFRNSIATVYYDLIRVCNIFR